jgi:hypothetical protein
LEEEKLLLEEELRTTEEECKQIQEIKKLKDKNNHLNVTQQNILPFAIDDSSINFVH